MSKTKSIICSLFGGLVGVLVMAAIIFNAIVLSVSYAQESNYTDAVRSIFSAETNTRGSNNNWTGIPGDTNNDGIVDGHDDPLQEGDQNGDGRISDGEQYVLDNYVNLFDISTGFEDDWFDGVMYAPIELESNTDYGIQMLHDTRLASAWMYVSLTNEVITRDNYCKSDERTFSAGILNSEDYKYMTIRVDINYGGEHLKIKACKTDMFLWGWSPYGESRNS